MGFDLTMLAAPTALPADFPVQYEGQPEYYRFTSQGMALMRIVLESAGALSNEDAPELPAWPPLGLDESRAEAIAGGGDCTEQERRSYDAWKHALHEATSRPSCDTRRVARHKFES